MAEKLMNFNNNFFPSFNLKESKRQEIYEELILKQKELANEIYIQRCKEKYL